MSNLSKQYFNLVDSRTGIIRYIEEMDSLPDFPRFHHCAGMASDIRAFSLHENSLPSGGASICRETAIAKTIGEAVERYCSGLYDSSAYPLSCAADADFPCVPPSEFATNDPEEIKRIHSPWQPFTDKTIIRWAPMQSLGKKCTLYVPAAYIHVPYYYYLDEGDTPIVQPISTGLACHSDLALASVNAISEVIERDAFMSMWQARMSLPHICQESLPSHLHDILARFNVPDSQITLLLSLQDHAIPTVISVYQSKAETMPALVFSASTALEPAIAIHKSLEELAHTLRWSYALKIKNPNFVATPDFSNVTGQDEHLLYWGRQSFAHNADFVFASTERVRFSDIENFSQATAYQDVLMLRDKIKAIEHDILLSELTSPDIQALGFYVVRAVIPGFQPLAMGHINRVSGNKRLLTLPQKLGYQGIDPTVGDNPFPHPFP